MGQERCGETWMRRNDFEDSQRLQLSSNILSHVHTRKFSCVARVQCAPCDVLFKEWVLFSSLVLVFLRWRWAVHLMLIILCRRLGVWCQGPALCPAQLSSEAPIQDDTRHWLSSVCLSLLDPWSPVVETGTMFSFVSRSQSCGPRLVTFKQTFNSSPTCFVVSLLSTVFRYWHPGQPSLRPYRSKSALRK